MVARAAPDIVALGGPVIHMVALYQIRSELHMHGAVSIPSTSDKAHKLPIRCFAK